MSAVLDPGRAARKAAEKAAAEQETEIKRQRQVEEAKLAEEESAIETRRQVAKTGGRRSLIATSAQGVTDRAKTLGG